MEFEYRDSTYEGVVFKDGSLKIWSLFGRPCPTKPNSLTFVNVGSWGVDTIRKVGECGVLPGHSQMESENIAQAYFSKPATPEFKVGDKVKVARAKGGTISWLSSMNSFLGEVCTVAYASTNSVSVHENSWSWPIESLDPA